MFSKRLGDGGGILLTVAVICIRFSPAALADGFAPRVIVQSKSAPAIEQLAARELQRHVYLLTGTLPEVAEQVGDQPAILIGTPKSNPAVAELARSGAIDASPERLGAQGFVLKSLTRHGRSLLVAGATGPVGCLYAAYTLLEYAGAGFYLGGDTLPPRSATLIRQRYSGTRFGGSPSDGFPDGDCGSALS